MSNAEQNSQNKLASETSPYLLQHANNPVNWLPWGEDAFEKARLENKPVFLSVGYSSCHWCHVMEHESFEDAQVAELLNTVAICIKVDREERPDVDEIYMLATQLITGRGGWPNSVWLLPDRRPWYAGTYYPKESFMALIQQVDSFWKTKRDAVEQQAAELTQAIQQHSSAQASNSASGSTPLDSAQLEVAEHQLLQNVDPRHGGFGGAPKFPPHASLRFLLNREKNPAIEQTLLKTLDHMAAGGIRDHIGGGFHRYATDQNWFLPHFEKMLYDNAQLLWVYSEAAFQYDNPEYVQVAKELYQWAVRDFKTETDNLFFSAYDADSEGEEGKFYLWTYEEILNLLGETEGKKFTTLYNITPEGNYFEEASGKRTIDNIPHLAPENLAGQTEEWVIKAKQKLNDHRSTRIPPFLDDKEITSWNGLMIGGLARAGFRLNDQEMLNQAEATAEGVLAYLKKDGELFRSRRNGISSGKGFLDDYAYLADGLLELYTATKNKRWLDEAAQILETLHENFSNEEGTGYFFTSSDHETLLHRSLDPYDNATPSGNAVAARAWLKLAQYSESEKAFTRGKSLLFSFSPWITRAPTASMTFHEVLQLYLEISPEFKEVTDDFISFNLDSGETPNLYTLIIHIADGSHVLAASTNLAASQTPLSFSIETKAGTEEISPKSLPESHELPMIGNVYAGKLELHFDLSSVNTEEAMLRVHWQLCTDKVCLPAESMDLSIPTETSSSR